jgi:hypothetical protein
MGAWNVINPEMQFMGDFQIGPYPLSGLQA